MHSFSKKKKKTVSLYCGHLSLESSEDYVLLFLLNLPMKRKYFNLGFLHKSEWEVFYLDEKQVEIFSLHWKTCLREPIKNSFIRVKFFAG